MSQVPWSRVAGAGDWATVIGCVLSTLGGVSQPIAECRRWRLWKISRYSKIAFASSTRVRQRRRLRSSTCMRDQNDSMTALS